MQAGLGLYALTIGKSYVCKYAGKTMLAYTDVNFCHRKDHICTYVWKCSTTKHM